MSVNIGSNAVPKPWKVPAIAPGRDICRGETVLEGNFWAGVSIDLINELESRNKQKIPGGSFYPGGQFRTIQFSAFLHQPNTPPSRLIPPFPAPW